MGKIAIEAGISRIALYIPYSLPYLGRRQLRRTGRMPEYVTLGIDVETGQPIRIGDVERCGGLYVLGKTRTGKSNLFISLALQDIARGMGLLFIDPHADAIQAILDRLP